MKKIVCIMTVALLLLSTVFALVACTPREEILKVRNWGEYMSKEVYQGFEKWYKDRTGKNITVQYSEFSTNEDLYTEIAVKGKDYDVMCPSDYMIERMIREDMLQPLNAETQAVVAASVSDKLATLVKQSYDPNLSYSMPYMWGTMGIMYNSKSQGLNDDVVSTWDVMWDAKYEDKLFMKDSVRDSYSIALLRENGDTLLNTATQYGYDSEQYQALLTSIFSECDDNKIEVAKNSLLQQKSLLRGYEVDSAKDDMQRDINGEKGYLGVFWSCDAGYIMNGDEESGANRNLRYIVPKEGSNVWVDGFVINKNAGNVDAANLFIQYLCDPDVAYECMDYVGSTTGVAAAADNYKADVIANADEMFAGAAEGFLDMYIEMMFPSDETLSRCGIMRDFGDFNQKLDEMWEQVRI